MCPMSRLKRLGLGGTEQINHSKIGNRRTRPNAHPSRPARVLFHDTYT